MADTIRHREGSSAHIDLIAREQTGTDSDGNPILERFSIGDRRVAVVVKDSVHDRARVVFDSAESTQRITVEPEDDQGNPQTGVVRVWPRHEEFRTEWNPYTVFLWVFKTSSDKIDFPRDAKGHTIEILPAWGTDDL